MTTRTPGADKWREHVGFPHSVHPTGWFQVAWERDLETPSVTPLRYFDTDLVLVRTESGDVQVLDAHCAHMGAHLGYGGTVQDGCVVCPFHGWEWNTKGENTRIPADPGRTSRRTMRTWPTAASNGIVWMWHDAAGREPQWDPPETLRGYGSDDYFPIHPGCIKLWPQVKTLPQYVIENNADLDHLHYIHKAQGPVEMEKMELDGPCLRASVKMIFGYGKKSTWLTPDGPTEARMVSESWGLGVMIIDYEGTDDSIAIQCQTPIDADHCDLFHTLILPRRGATGNELSDRARKRLREDLTQIERDFVVWENMAYLQHAALTGPEARPISAIRKWADQFYPESADTEQKEG